MAKSILIKDASWIVTQNSKREILKDNSVYIEDNRIVEIGKTKEKADIVLDGKNKIIMPGLINTHTHLGMTILRGFLDDMELHEWLKKCWKVEPKLTGNEVYHSSLLGCLEMIKNGITCFHDMYYFGNHVLKAVDESGMRCIFSQAVVDTPYMQEFKTPDQALKLVLPLKRKWEKNERTVVNLGPHAIYTCSRETLTKVKQFAADNDLSIQIHLSETKKEVEDSLQKNGMRPVEYLEDIGLLSPKIVAVHCCWLTEKEITLLKSKDVKISHCPVSNLKTTSGIAPVPKMIEHGLCVGLGTDSAVSNNSLDLFQEMKFAALLHKYSSGNPTTIPAQTALDLATINGAKALGLKNIGSLEVGKNADVIILDLKKPNLMPILSRESVISHLVYSATGNDVETTIINGKIIMKNKKILTIDEEEVYENVDKITQELKDLINKSSNNKP